MATQHYFHSKSCLAKRGLKCQNRASQRPDEHQARIRIRVKSLEKTSTTLAPHLERFAASIAIGLSKADAAVACGRRNGSAFYLFNRPGVQERIEELRQVAKKKTADEVANGTQSESSVRDRSRVEIDRNGIINGLASIGCNEKAPFGPRVAAFTTLAHIFLLFANNLEDLRNYHGWTGDELDQHAEKNELDQHAEKG